jgi:hypothetical protein
VERLDSLVAHLSRISAGQTLAVVGVYPAKGETGHLDRQGEIIESVWDALEPILPAASAYRVMWAQVAVVVGSNDLEQVAGAVSTAIRQCGDESVELRAVAVLLQPRDAVETLDKVLGELSSRRNFGSEAIGIARRLIGPKEWAPTP